MATILIVEDNPDDRFLLTRLLKEYGHLLLEAEDGVEALTVVRSKHPDLVIADVLLPRMDGYEFVRQLREDPAIAHTPVVFFTGVYHKPEDAIALAKVCGVSHIIPKSTKSEEVLKIVAVTLSLSHPPSPAPHEEFDRENVRVVTAKLTEKIQELEAVKKQLAKRFEIYHPESRARPILLVEDNPMDIDLTLQAFEEHSVLNPIAICRDGEEALRYIETHTVPEDSGLPILVLLDLRLPKVDGIEVLRQARQHPVWKQIPVVVITTSREDSDIEAAYQLGVNSYIVKPVEFATFAEMVKTIKVYWLLTNEPPFRQGDKR